MMATRQQLDDFYQFATDRVAGSCADLSLDELYLIWRSRRPATAELSQGVAAVKAAFADLQSGDAGRPARAALRDACQEFGLVIGE